MALEHPSVQDDTEEKSLVLAFKQGESFAYGQIYARYAPRVQSLCRRMLGDTHDAEEATQEVFVRVYQGLGRFNGRYQLGAWITRISTNVCLDLIRSRNRRPSDPAPLEELALDISEAPLDDEPETFVIRRAEGRHVRKILDQLPPLHRAAIVLRDFEGLSYEEVAVALSITECQTKALIHRARKSFKRAWLPLEAAGLLLPWRWIPKVRKLDVSTGESAVHVARASAPLADAATSVGQVATSCSAALQQCGQFMAERVAALATTVIVGSAAVGGVAIGRATAPTPLPAPRTTLSTQQVAGLVVRGGTEEPKQHRVERSSDDGDATEPAALPTSQPAPAEPVPADSPAEETPAPEPSPSPSASDSSSGKPPKESPPPKPAPPQVSLSFDRAGTTKSAPPDASSGSVSCSGNPLTQELDAPLHDEGASYAAHLSLGVTTTNANLAFTITKDGADYTYNGGAPSVQISRSGGVMTIAFSGSYGWNGGPQPSEYVGLPDAGRVSARITLDCATNSLVTESLVLTT